MRKRLIEEILPLAEIGVESSKSVAYGDIHAIHTWFARRPLAACRAATFAALVDAPATEAEREELLELIKRGLLNTAPRNDKPAIDEMRRRVLEAYEGRAPRVLDPFAGGGSLPLEATRLGCEAYASDLNPVALLTLLGTVDYPMRYATTQFLLPPAPEDLWDPTENEPCKGNLVEAIRAWSEWVLARVKPELDPFYPPDDTGRTVVAYFWAKTVPCKNPSCGAEIPLLAHRWLSRRAGKPPVAYRLLLQPDKTFEVEILHGDAATADNPVQGTMARGSVQCPFCASSLSPDEVKAAFISKRDGRLLLSKTTSRQGESGVSFAPASVADRQAYQAARDVLTQSEATHDDPFLSLVPDEPFPERARSIDPGRYGVRTWGEMFNPRQALALVTFARYVREGYGELQRQGASPEEAKVVALYMAFTLSRMSVRMSEASRWDPTRDNVQKATEGHRLPMLWDYTEANPLSGGSGSWQGTNEWALPSIERLLGVGKSANVTWADATQLVFPDNHFDAVLTDPPYYDSVCYSDLSDIQYVWLHRTLFDIMPEFFAAPLTPKAAEIRQESARHASEVEAKAFFEEHLRLSLCEIRRVLKPEGISLVMYAHTDTRAWESLVSALIGAGLQVTASWPVNTETVAKRVWLGGAVLAATIFLVCRKRSGEKVGYIDQILPEMREEVRRALDSFWAAGIGGADFFVSAIGPALSVYSRYAEVRYGSGQVVTVANFLTLVRQAVVEHSLERALAGADVGEVDRETQFTLLWRWTYRLNQVEIGAARLLDKATGVELVELEKLGLLARVANGQKMILRGPQERPGLMERTLRRAQVGHAPIIDVIHCACLLWRDGRRDELASLLDSRGNVTRQVAQALAGLLPESSEERKLLLGLLGGWRQTGSSREEPVQPTQLPLL